MTLVSSKIIVPQHIEYLIVDRDLVIFEYSQDISRFFLPDRRVIQGQDVREFLPELSNYKTIINKILAGKKKHFSLPQINFNSQINQFENSVISTAIPEVYFNIHLAHHLVEHDSYLIIFLEEITINSTSTCSFNNPIGEYSLLQNLSQLSHQLAQSTHFYERVFASMAEALIITNDIGIIQQVNQCTVNLLGYTKAELVNQSINKIIADTKFLLSEIQQYLLTQGELIKNIEVICQTKQGSTQIISFTCSRIKTENNDDNKLIYLGRDITNLKRYQQRQTVQSSISKILAGSQNFTQAAPKILQVICETLDLFVGEIWVKSTNIVAKQKIQCEIIWTKNPSQVSKLVEITQKSMYGIAEDIVGDIWLNNSFCWYDNQLQALDYYRHNIALELGLKGGFGLPIQGDNNILAVMNFFFQREKELDEDLVDLMIVIANQIGQFIQRKQAEAALRYQQEESEKLLLNILPEMIAVQLKKTK